MAMDPRRSAGARVAVERLEISTKKGSVMVKDLVVTEAMNVVTKDGNGKVEAQVEADKVVSVKAKNDVSLSVESWSNKLDLKVDSSNKVQVAMVSFFFFLHCLFPLMLAICCPLSLVNCLTRLFI